MPIVRNDPNKTITIDRVMLTTLSPMALVIWMYAIAWGGDHFEQVSYHEWELAFETYGFKKEELHIALEELIKKYFAIKTVADGEEIVVFFEAPISEENKTFYEFIFSDKNKKEVL